jgi:hypothetical protein
MNRDLGFADLPLLGSDPPVYAEKRRHPRHQLAVRCWISDGKHTVYARVHDVSLGGLSIRAPIAFQPNAQLELALVLPVPGLDHTEGLVAVRAVGRVVWVRAREAGPRMGAEFVDVISGEHALRRLLGA